MNYHEQNVAGKSGNLCKAISRVQYHQNEMEVLEWDKQATTAAGADTDDGFINEREYSTVRMNNTQLWLENSATNAGV